MSGPVDVLAVLDEVIECDVFVDSLMSRLRQSRAAVAELIDELRHAQTIIQLALQHVPADARSPWLLAIDDAGLCGEGVTRFHERKTLLARIGGAS